MSGLEFDEAVPGLVEAAIEVVFALARESLEEGSYFAVDVG